jgi:hypothetical protein
MFLTRALLTSLVFLSAYANAEPLNLFGPINPAPVWPGLSLNMNHAPAFHVRQNEPELSSFNTSATSGVTDLCIPATMADVLLFQVSARSPRLQLKVPGVNVDGTANGADTVKAMIQYCGFNPRTALNPSDLISWSEAIPCLSRFYLANGFQNPKIQYVRKGQGQASGMIYHDRDPNLKDIQTALDSGAEVIATISYQQQNSSGVWVQTGSHSVNLFGYGANPNDLNHLTVYLQNSNRAYSMNFIDPVFDVVLLTDNQEPAPVTEKSSSIELSTLQGRLINFPNKRTFFSSLIIIKTE